MAPKAPKYSTPFWFVDGEVYDFAEFRKIHPGGQLWFDRNVHRELNVMFRTYHKDPQKLTPILAKYKVAKEALTEEHKKASPFFLHFDPSFRPSDLPKFRYDDPGTFLYELRKLVLKPEFQKKLKIYDTLFDIITAILLVLYFPAVYALLLGWVTPFLAIPVLLAIRISLVGAGHYYAHAKKPCIGEALLEFNFVGSALNAFDKHVMAHHLYPTLKTDMKPGLLMGTRGLPGVWRYPGLCIHRLGTVVSGYFFVGYRMWSSGASGMYDWYWWLARAWLCFEFFSSVFLGPYALSMWLLQFSISLWHGCFLVFASHEYETTDIQPRGFATDDWGAFQVQQALDVQFFGNPWIDIWLSAGLSPHRTHHVLPYQRSGFANILSEPLVKEVCEKFGIKWERRIWFWTERLPYQFYFFLTSPIIDTSTGLVASPNAPEPFSSEWVLEHVSPTNLLNVATYAMNGFLGINVA